jgi:hypothetical protein
MRLRALLAVVSATLLLAATTATATAAIPAPPGGPILVVTGGDRYGDYYAEILRAEGLNEFARADVSQLSADTLASYDVVVLASTGLSSAQVATLDAWVRGGGNLVAMRPDKALAPLLGLSDAGGTLSNGYLRVDTSQPPAGAGPKRHAPGPHSRRRARPVRHADDQGRGVRALPGPRWRLRGDLPRAASPSAPAGRLG